jgi:hypothetical protein
MGAPLRRLEGACSAAGTSIASAILFRNVNVRILEVMMKGASKPKKLAKKQPQKTLKEKRSEKRAATKKFGSS